ncbi:hypothetical protein BJ944DRAFT_285919 [Cunninghamella echinulata]|nr:hypothetical protein BJ944DRAFT_285919 [Cunninghamella echinulata]
MTEQPRVFKATYSSVAVYELMCKDIAVMRRRDDGYVNATQILKVAEFGKAQRTRILEREIQIGIHEKIQGGYGKYQGTWIPLERGKELARRYDVFELLSPLLMFQEGSYSPPLAPKHSISNSYKPKVPREPKIPKKKRLQQQQQQQLLQRLQTHQQVDGYLDSGLPSGSSRTLAYYHLQRHQINNNNNNNMNLNYQQEQYYHDDKRKRLYHQTIEEEDEEYGDINMEEGYEVYESNEPYDVQLLRHFISGDNRVPSLLIHPPSDLDFNIIIDDEGHTSLHWAAAMGHLKIVKLLIHHGADIYRVNYKGQTALIRSVLFTNNFERRSFPLMLDMLRKTIFNIDKKDQTVFHHIASTAGWKGKVHASRYYMDCLMEKIRSQKEDLARVLNVQDVYGDTALTIASRIGNKKLVRLLVDAGANPQLVNEEGKTSQDYIMELEGYIPISNGMSSGVEENIRKRAKNRVDEVLKKSFNKQKEKEKQVDHHQNDYGSPSLPNQSEQHQQEQSIQSLPVLCDVTKIVDEFINSFERDQEHKEQLLRETSLELQSLRKRLDMTNKSLSQLNGNPNMLEIVECQSATVQKQLHKIMEYTQRFQLGHLIEERENELMKSTTMSNNRNHNHNNMFTFEKSSTATSPLSSSTLLLSPILPLSTSNLVTPSSTIETMQKLSDIDNNNEASSLEAQLKQLMDERKSMIYDIIELQGQMPNKRYQDYKRLISMCCNVGYDDVDLMLSPLLASFEQSEQDQVQQQQQSSPFH